MTQSAVDVEVKLKLTDGTTTTAGLKAVTQTAVKEAEKATTATEKAAQKAAEAAEKSASRQRSSYEKLSQARETLGIRSEKVIQKEIENTRRAYAQLAAAGFSSAQEQERAYAAVQKRITTLTNEMGRLTSAQKKSADEAKRLAQIEADHARNQKVLRYGAAAAAGIGTAAYTLKGPAEKTMSYDRRLANMANTAYAERDAAGRIVGMKTLEDDINKARRHGGGTREQTADALDTMLASGTVSEDEARVMLPGIMKSATASNTDANALATIAIRAKQSFKIKAEDIPAVLSAALAAGQAGGFELKDMAKWLPQQMAMAGNLGLSGKEGFAKLAAWNQASVITAGTKDEAGNNLRDLLNELNTPHFRKFMAEQYLANGQKAKKGDKEKRMKSVDEVFLDYQSRGIDKVSATVEMMQSVFAKDKTFQSLQAKLRATDKNDKDGQRSIIEAMAAQVQGTAIGKVFHNQQSLMAFLGLMNNQKYAQGVLDKVRAEYRAKEDKTATSTAYQVISGTSGYKVEQAKEEYATAQKSSLDNLTPAIGKAADAFSDFAQKHPALSTATISATTALTALAASAGVSALLSAGKAGADGGKAGSVGGALRGAASWLANSPAARLTGAVGLAGAVGYGIGTGANWLINKGMQWGTGDQNQTLGGWLYDKLHPENPLVQNIRPAVEQPKLDAKLHLSVSDDRVSVKSAKLDAFGVNASMNTGNIRTGAPG